MTNRSAGQRSAMRGRVLRLALPIMAGMVSQTIVNLVDTAMVGWVGTDALAAVGLASFLNMVCAAFVMGMATGVQAKAAQLVGAGRPLESAIPLNGGLLLAIVIAIPMSVVGIALAPWLFPILAGDPAVGEHGVPYLQARLAGVVVLGMNFAFRGYWNAIERSGIYLRTVLVIHVVNVVLNWLLIFGNLGFPALGAQGAGVASSLALLVGTVCYFVMGRRHASAAGFLARVPDRETLRDLFRLSAPAGMQQLLFFLGMTAFFALLAQIGTSALAAGAVLVNVLLAWILPANAFGLAASSLAGQAFGAGDPDDANAWTWLVARMAMVIVGVLALPAVLFPEVILSVFLHDPATLELATTPLRLVACFIPFEALTMVLLNAHLGVGASRRVLLIASGTQWFAFLPGAVILVWWFSAPLWVIWAWWVFLRSLTAVIFAASWKSRFWATAAR